jgi:hypothetical protein
LEKPKKITKNVFTQGTFLQNYRKIYQMVSERDAGTDGWTDSSET